MYDDRGLYGKAVWQEYLREAERGRLVMAARDERRRRIRIAAGKVTVALHRPMPTQARAAREQLA